MSGQDSMQAGQSGMRGQADQQILSQLQQIASDPKTAGDKLFVLHAGLGNQLEVSLAQLAQTKAQSSEVKQAAQHILQDHQKAQQELQQVASKVGVQIPQGLPAMKQQEMQILAALPAEEFEKSYTCMMQADHAKDILDYRSQSQTAKNEDVKRYASNQLSALQQHAQMLNQAATALNLPSSNDAQPASATMSPGTSGSSSQTHGQNPPTPSSTPPGADDNRR